VEVTGEVFFDVAPDSRHPFIVRAHKEDIEVLGTAFVVSDYPGEKHAKVAVASGLVRVRNGKDSTQIRSSQGANIGEGGEIKIDPDMDVRSVLALKEEYFNFDGLDIKAALTQLAQSYHMRILFDDNIKSGPFGSGNIERDLPIKRLLKDLELPDLHFEVNMQDNTIVVTR
jgi:ferric-dicitrate binding protein FerR (iron transport regulator)